MLFGFIDQKTLQETAKLDFSRVRGVIALTLLASIIALWLFVSIDDFPADSSRGNAPADKATSRRLVLGEHLAGECVTCHRKGADKNGIPDITGRSEQELVRLLGEFKAGERNNPAMVSVAKSLDDEQMAALAAYFARQ